jgi:DNA-binding transcriptional LysR family regulator
MGAPGRQGRKIVELRRFRYFVAVAEELHFRRAAERLHLAQPALSQQVKKLEVELGVDLFHRTRRGVALTSAGVVFLEEARHVLRLADEAARAAQEAATGSVGRLRVGLLADAVPTRVSQAIVRFSTRFPGVDVNPETLSARRAIEDVRAGRLDVAVVALPAPISGLGATSLGREGTVAAVADRHPLSGRPSVPMDRLADQRLVMLPRVTNPAFYDGVIAACRDAGFTPSIVETTEPQIEHALLKVAGGAGIALLPASAADRYMTPGVRFLPLEPEGPVCEMALVTRPEADDEALVSAFAKLARENVKLGAVAAPATLAA